MDRKEITDTGKIYWQENAGRNNGIIPLPGYGINLYNIWNTGK